MIKFESDNATIAGIRKRDSKGKIVSRASRIRGERQRQPSLSHRTRLFADGQQRLAWQAEAGYPLGVYFLREELTQAQFQKGQLYALRRVQAARLMGVPRPVPRTISLDPDLRGQLCQDGEPSATTLARAQEFMEQNATLRADLPRPWWALQLCLLSEVMGKVEERFGVSAAEVALPVYTIADLLAGLDALAKRKLC